MKIDEECINHNAVRVIKAIISAPNVLTEQGQTLDKNSMNLMMVGAISGVIEMTDALKEVLKC